MALREIVYIGDPVLRKKAMRVRDFDDDLRTMLDDMAETMIAAPGVGLAAPQIGVSQRVIVVRLPDDPESQEEYGDLAGVLFEVINPEIIKHARTTIDGIEGCLSIPGYLGEVDRFTAVTVRGQDRHGKEIRIKAHDWLARVFQHEIDHLEGVLFIDIANEVWEPRSLEEDAQEEPAE